MAVSPNAAARRICERGNWQVTNLALQKILYLIHMVHLGTEGEPLINTQFEAWDYGPVEPNLYHRCKMFGAREIQDVFIDVPEMSDKVAATSIDDGCNFLIGKKPGELVAMTHWKDGAWARNYVPGTRGVTIPESDIIAEYRARVG